jgi:hypothetical protein
MSSDPTMSSLQTAKRPRDPPPPINTKSPSVGGIDSLAKGQDPSTIMAGENPISRSPNTRNDIEEVTMDWDS